MLYVGKLFCFLKNHLFSLLLLFIVMFWLIMTHSLLPSVCECLCFRFYLSVSQHVLVSENCCVMSLNITCLKVHYPFFSVTFKDYSNLDTVLYRLPYVWCLFLINSKQDWWCHPQCCTFTIVSCMHFVALQGRRLRTIWYSHCRWRMKLHHKHDCTAMNCSQFVLEQWAVFVVAASISHSHDRWHMPVQ